MDSKHNAIKSLELVKILHPNFLPILNHPKALLSSMNEGPRRNLFQYFLRMPRGGPEKIGDP